MKWHEHRDRAKLASISSAAEIKRDLQHISDTELTISIQRLKGALRKINAYRCHAGAILGACQPGTSTNPIDIGSAWQSLSAGGTR